MKQECIDILKMYIEKQSPNQLNERMLNKILACAKLYDNAEDLIDCIKILKNEIFQKIISFEEKKFMEDIKLGKYRHFKGNEYEVIGIAKHSETLAPMVVYKALYGEGGIWVRPAEMWNETVERDGKTFKRFTYIGD